MMLRYAQEVRQYSLWLTLVLCSSALLLRAYRLRHGSLWGLYAIAVALGIYCHLLTGLVVLGQGLYLLAMERFRITRVGLTFLGWASLGIALTLPWLIMVVRRWDIVAETTAYSTLPLSRLKLGQAWLVFLDRTVLAAHFRHTPWLMLAAIPIVGLLAYSLVYGYHRAPKRAWLFLGLLMASSVIPFLLPDLLWGGRRTTYDRYFLSCYAGFYIALGFLFASELTKPPMQRLRYRIWQTISIATVICGMVSSTTSVRASTWWGWSEFDVEIGQIINAAPAPLVIADVPFYGVAAISHELKPETEILLIQDLESFRLPGGNRSMFLYSPSATLLNTPALQTSEGAKPVPAYQFKDPITGFELALFTLSR